MKLNVLKESFDRFLGMSSQNAFTPKQTVQEEDMNEAFSKQHYVEIANILKQAQSVDEVRNALIALFKRDNPRFDEKRFLDASR